MQRRADASLPSRDKITHYRLILIYPCDETIKMCPRGKTCEHIEWMYLAEDRDQWRALMNFGFVTTWLHDFMLFLFPMRTVQV